MGQEATNVIEWLKRRRDRIAELEKELHDLRSELDEVETAVLGGQARSQSRSKPKSRHGFTGGKRARPIQAGSTVDRTLQLLRNTRRPMRVDEIVECLNQQVGQPKVNKPTLVSNLSRYVKYGDTFVRPAPSTFALKDLVLTHSGTIDFNEDAGG